MFMSTRLLVFLILQSYRFLAAGAHHCDLCGHTAIQQHFPLANNRAGKKKELIVDEIHIFPNKTINEYMKGSIC